MSTIETDRSDAADARRMRWILAGNVPFLSAAMLCQGPTTTQEERDEARHAIDKAIAEATNDYPGGDAG